MSFFARHSLVCAVAQVSLCGLGASSWTGATLDAQESKWNLDVEWKDVRNQHDAERSSAIQVAAFELTDPRLIKGVAARIELEGPIEFVVTPGNGDDELDTMGLRTSTFLETFHCDLAINGAPFAPVLSLEGGKHDISGLQMAAGEVVSANDSNRPCLLIGSDNQISIEKPRETSGLYHAITGFAVVLEDGKILGQTEPLHPRTAAGISSDGKVLYLIAIDGRQSDFSEGVSTSEAGAILKSLGAQDGINLDGGGTTTMVARNCEGSPVVLNRPIHAGVPGLQRPSASHLGVRYRAKK